MSLNDDKIRFSSLIHLRGTIQVFSEMESSQALSEHASLWPSVATAVILFCENSMKSPFKKCLAS